MNMRDVFGMVNFHSSPNLQPLTDFRPIGSTSFLGRYALCDFALSNFCNSGIARIGLLVKDHERSILKHIGGMDSWTQNTKTGQMRVLINEEHLSTELNTDVNNITANNWVLYDSNSEYVVIVPAHIIAPIDYRPILEQHIANKEKITIIATRINDASKEYLYQDLVTLDRMGYVEDLRYNDGSVGGPALACMSMMIINRTALAELLHQYLPKNPTMHLGDLVYRAAVEGSYRVKCHIYEGYSRCFDSFEHYVQYSFEFLDRENFNKLFLPDWPIYTITQDTPPSIYGEEARVNNSVVSNGAIVEGAVVNSILCRNVKVSKGAVVRNSIIFSSCKIGEGAVVENALLDKYAIVTRGHTVKGEEGATVFINQGIIV